jgi:hypothetical protein
MTHQFDWRNALQNIHTQAKSLGLNLEIGMAPIPPYTVHLDRDEYLFRGFNVDGVFAGGYVTPQIISVNTEIGNGSSLVIVSTKEAWEAEDPEDKIKMIQRGIFFSDESAMRRFGSLIGIVKGADIPIKKRTDLIRGQFGHIDDLINKEGAESAGLGYIGLYRH